MLFGKKPKNEKTRSITLQIKPYNKHYYKLKDKNKDLRTNVSPERAAAYKDSLLIFFTHGHTFAGEVGNLLSA